MKNNICETCSAPVMRARRGEKPAKWIDLQPDPVRRPSGFRPRQGARYVDGRTAFWPDEMARRVESSGDRISDFPMHLEHQCGGK